MEIVPSKQNPEDDATRGFKLSMSPKNGRWIHAPNFLYLSSREWLKQPNEWILCNDDKESKKMKWNIVATLIKINSNSIVNQGLYVIAGRRIGYLRIKRVFSDRLSSGSRSQQTIKLTNLKRIMVGTRHTSDKNLFHHYRKWPKQPNEWILCNDDKELKKMKCNNVATICGNIISTVELQTSKWHRMKRTVAKMLN